ncbi:hypothetical protein ACFXPV_28185 [Streptomyces sp. NPDC059118]
MAHQSSDENADAGAPSIIDLMTQALKDRGGGPSHRQEFQDVPVAHAVTG